MQRRTLIITAALVLSVLAAFGGNAQAAGYSTEDFTLTTDEGIELEVYIAIPDGEAPDDGWPAIIPVHGYGGSRDRGLARFAAEHGFVGFAHSTRGFGDSTGQMDVVGPGSMRDLQYMVDWLAAGAGGRAPVDPDGIGVTGASYGGAHSFLAGALLDGVAAVAPIAGWTDLRQALYTNNVFKLSYATGFYATGNQVAERYEDTYDPQVHTAFTELAAGFPTQATEDLLAARSAKNFIDTVDVPMFIIQGMNDDLFPADQVLDFFDAIGGKDAGHRLYLGYVGHPRASPDTSTDEVAQLYDQVAEFFTCHLKHDAAACTDFYAHPAIEVTTSGGSGDYFGIDAWPEGGTTYQFEPLGGGLTTADAGLGAFTLSNTFAAGTPDDPVIPFLFEEYPEYQGDQAGGWYRGLPAGSAADTTVFSLPVDADTRLLGTPELDLWITPTSPRHQVVGKVYDVDPDGGRTLVTRGVWGERDAATDAVQRLQFDLQPYHYVFAAGHTLEVTIAASDFPAYMPEKHPFTTVVHTGEDPLGLHGASGVVLPLAPA